jgi:hypothetical protein
VEGTVKMVVRGPKTVILTTVIMLSVGRDKARLTERSEGETDFAGDYTTAYP